VAHLPDALRRETQLGREFLRETLTYVRGEAQEDRPRVCPVRGRQLGTLTPQHMAHHDLPPHECYRRLPETGFTRRAGLVIQPGPQGLLETTEAFGLDGSGGRI
jgi:hypothetical protein